MNLSMILNSFVKTREIEPGDSYKLRSYKHKVYVCQQRRLRENEVTQYFRNHNNQ